MEQWQMARFSDVDEKQPHYYSTVVHRISKDGTEAGVMYSRGAREAIATVVKVAGISTSNIKSAQHRVCVRWKG
jgi:hypothetical protein